MHTIAPPGLWKARHLSRAAFAALGALTVLLIIAHIQLTCGAPKTLDCLAHFKLDRTGEAPRELRKGEA